MIETRVRMAIATQVTHATLFTSEGATTRRIALAAGTVAETMKIQQRTRSAHPAKNPAVFPKIVVTQVNDVPALGLSLLRWMKAQAIPNMMNPEMSMLAGEKTHAIPMMVNAVASIEKAGAVPAIPMMMDSIVPREFARSVCFCMKRKRKNKNHREKISNGEE